MYKNSYTAMINGEIMRTVCFSDIIFKKRKHENYNVRDELMNLPFYKIIEEQKKNTLPISGMSINTVGDYNISSMIRTSSIMGFENFYVFGRRRFDKRGLVGSNNYIKVECIHGLTEKYVTEEPKLCVETLKNFLQERKIAPIVLEITGEDIRKINWKEKISNLKNNGKNPTIIVGNEWDGFSEEVFDLLVNYSDSTLVKIPHRGVIRSLNVGHCYAIAAWEITREL
jgi:tRNA G18 (ribose-2'-O)-methylase SpoU